MIDIEQFCGALDADNPAGSDLEYDPEFHALEVAQQGKGERQYGDTIIPAEPPDWKQVLEHAQSLAGRTRDLRVACALTRSLTHLQGLAGMVDGLKMIERLCRDLWDHVYPALDEDDDKDPTLRMNALAPLADPAGLLADLRESVFLSARGMGSCTVRQLEIALGILTPTGDDAQRLPEMSQIDAIAAAAQAEGSLQDNWAQQAIDLAQNLQAQLAGIVGVAMAPNLQPLVARLRPLAEYARRFVAAGEAAAAPAERGSALDTEPSPVLAAYAAAPRAFGDIRSSDDAARMLDLICAYFEKHEPTNPAPLLLRRAQRLSTMNFYDIVRDIAPDAIGAVDMVAGNRDTL